MEKDKLKNELDRKAAERAERRNRARTYKDRPVQKKEETFFRDRDFAFPPDSKE